MQTRTQTFIDYLPLTIFAAITSLRVHALTGGKKNAVMMLGLIGFSGLMFGRRRHPDIFYLGCGVLSGLLLLWATGLESIVLIIALIAGCAVIIGYRLLSSSAR